MIQVYAIKSDVKDWIYVGMTDDLERRFLQHNKGQNKSTKPYKPFRLLFYEQFPNTKKAREREKFLKMTSGKRWILDFIKKSDKELPIRFFQSH